MRFGRKAFVAPGEEAYWRNYIFSQFSGPWPDFTLSERKALVERIKEVAAFSELTVRAFAVTERSFHLLIDEPREMDLEDKEMFRRFQKTGTELFKNSKPALQAGDLEAWKRLRQRFGNQASFLKKVKQVTAQHYHRERGTSGALWQSRYESAFVQSGHASRFVAAWIAHANVRSGLAKAVEQDKLSFFGHGVSGDKWSRAMVASLFSEGGVWRKASQSFLNFLGSEPENALCHSEGSNRVPYLTRGETLRVEIENFSAGLAIGDREYLEEFFTLNRELFGPKRTSGARHVMGQNDPRLWTARQKLDLRKLGAIK